MDRITRESSRCFAVIAFASTTSSFFASGCSVDVARGKAHFDFTSKEEDDRLLICNLLHLSVIFLLMFTMVQDYVLTINNFVNDMVDFLPPGLILSFAASNVGNGKYFDVYVKEFIGSMLMIAFTFSAGKWIGTNSWEFAWVFHAMGVVAADYFGGGQQVNPAVTLSMWALGKCDYTEAFVRVAGQMGGGLISFPLFHALSEEMKWTPFGGPEFNMESNAEAAISEFVATFLLLWAIYIVSSYERGFAAGLR